MVRKCLPNFDPHDDFLDMVLMAQATESVVELTKIKISGVGDMAHWAIMFIV